eukprot:7523014-Lingulodinium_polyedra.AAC.1
MHGAGRAVAEVVFGILSPIWRLDPAAVATIGPIMMAVRALRAGTVALDWWRGALAAVAAGARVQARRPRGRGPQVPPHARARRRLRA